MSLIPSNQSNSEIVFFNAKFLKSNTALEPLPIESCAEIVFNANLCVLNHLVDMKSENK